MEPVVRSGKFRYLLREQRPRRVARESCRELQRQHPVLADERHTCPDSAVWGIICLFVIQTRKEGGGYILGFRVDGDGMLDRLHDEVVSMYETYANKPNFGIEFVVEEKPEQLEKLRVHRKEDDVEIIDVDDGVESLAAYAVRPRLPCEA